MTLDQAVALSLVPDLPRVGLDRPPPRRRSRICSNWRARCLDDARAVRAARRSGRHPASSPWNDPRFPAALLAISDAPPVLWYRGTLDALDAPAVAIVGSRAASAVALETAAQLARRPRRARHHRRQRPGARRRFRRASRRAADAAARSPCSVGRRPHLSARTRGARRRHRRDRPRPQRVSARHAAAAVSLSDAQPADQRPVARGRGRSRRPRSPGR